MKQAKTKFIFVIGGVMSGVGKGVTTASIGRILQSKGFTVSAIKIDPYVNVDAGTMNPTVHGEVFVTQDGDETDQDIGNYERFLDISLNRVDYMTTGRIYETVIARERNLGYHGDNVQVVPDIPNEVIRRIKKSAQQHKSDFVVIEIGGTVGEYENLIFLEAARMMKLADPDGVLFVLVSYLPIPKMIGEMKTKPTQHASRTLNSAGLQADFVVCRSEDPVDQKRRDKIARFCNISVENVISAPDAESIYNVPINFERQNLGNKILGKFHIKANKKDLKDWSAMVARMKRARQVVPIAVVGKYFSSGDYVLSDVYISVIEAIKHAGVAVGVKPELHWIDSEDFEKPKADLSILKGMKGIIVPGGFGTRGISGVIRAVKYAREKKIPYLGLCYGMQLATIEFARSVANIPDAQTVEIDPNTKDPIIHINDKQAANLAAKNMGNSMRLGAYRARLKRGSLVHDAYKKTMVSERHRHRYEFNNAYKDRLEKAGLIFSGVCPDNGLIEIIELPKETHPFFVGTQFHPELQSRPLTPHPLFVAFMRAAVGGKKK
ncbi:MAG: CTP synthase [Patescibacteria group bacterium]